VIQIKPALEKVLNLPNDALTKEISLTQDLLKLFIDFQIPSDLLSFDESLQSSSNPCAADKISMVRNHTDKMLQIIDNQKKEELKEKSLVASYTTCTAFGLGTQPLFDTSIHASHSRKTLINREAITPMDCFAIE
jgi:hypothetical protein